MRWAGSNLSAFHIGIVSFIPNFEGWP